MILQTKVDIDSYSAKIDYDSSIVMVGSCFSSNISKKLAERKFSVVSNPFGTIYNPKSVVDTLVRCERAIEVGSDDLFLHNGVYGSFVASTLFSSSSEQECIDMINSSVLRANRALKNADFMIITLGTNRCYYFKESGEAVANCHKIRADKFESRNLEADEIVSLFASLFDREPYKNMNIVFTVSPVRYAKYGFRDNSVSKAHLLIAIDQLARRYSNVSYFPAYEIFNDELRDYRFYDADLLHPSSVAVDYVWEKFVNSMISDSARGLMADVEDVIKRAAHRPFNRDSDSYRTFVDATLKKMGRLNKIAPKIDFREEKEKFL